MIVATAGHVDHGKTSLVRQLTGVDTDRLEEEKRRGLSINLGYAYLPLDEANSIGFIDVPGHRRFINTMIAGISGIDVGLLVVAADDGAMPQTREHLDVLTLLGVQQYILVLTKIDRVESSQLARVTADLMNLLPAETPVFPVSNTDGAGVAELAAELQQRALAQQPRDATGLFRMAIDRSFQLKGTGLVATGTVAAGRVSTGDILRLQPQNVEIRVRGIYAQNQPCAVGLAGQRCALNITGQLDRHGVNRGDWLSHIEAIPATSALDARLKLLPTAAFPLRHRMPVTVYLGAKHLSGRVLILAARDDRAQLMPGDSALVRLVLSSPVVGNWGDRFLIRDDSESELLGGGSVIDPLPPQQGKSRPRRIAMLEALEQADIARVLRDLLLSQQRVVSLENLRISRNWSDAKTEEVLASAMTQNMRRVTSDSTEWLVAEALWLQVVDCALETLRSWHRSHPGDDGLTPAGLRAQMASGERQVLLPAALTELLRRDAIDFAEGSLRCKGHRTQLPAAELKDWRRVEAVLSKHGVQIPSWSALISTSGLDQARLLAVVNRAVKEKRLHQLSTGRYALPVVMREVVAGISEVDGDNRGFSVIELRDQLGCGRNIVIEMLEYLDSQRITRREDQLRKVINHELFQQYLSY